MSTNGTFSDQVTSLPGLRKLEGVQFSGYASVNGAHCQPDTDESLFYWFVGSEDYASRPTILWTNGGPGSSSFWGFFLENGPLEVGTGADWDTISEGVVTYRPTGWNTQANYLIFEHPLTVTLSFAKDESNVPDNVGDGIDQFYEALQSFLAKHPEIRENEILLAGESYGGTYVPLLAKAILAGNAADRPHINLKGNILISGWVNPLIQQSMDSTYAFTHGLINQTQKEEVDKLYEQCAIEINKAEGGTTSKAAADACGLIQTKIKEFSGRDYMLNILQEGDPSTVLAQAYLNNQAVREAIHVPAISDESPAVTAFSSDTIYQAYMIGMENAYTDVVQDQVNGGLQTMVISGLDDGTDVNFLGVGAWIAEMAGDNFIDYHSATPAAWYTDSMKEPLGNIQEGTHFSWLRVVGGGHLCVRDQPKIIDKIMDTFYGDS